MQYSERLIKIAEVLENMEKHYKEENMLAKLAVALKAYKLTKEAEDKDSDGVEDTKEEHGKLPKGFKGDHAQAMAIKKISIKNGEKETVGTVKKLKKTAAPNGARDALRTISGAVLAGLGLGIAAKGVEYATDKIKEHHFESNLNKTLKEVKRISPELNSVPEKELKRIARAGYKLAPEIMEDPTYLAGFASIAKSLGGKVDPNTMKTIAEANAKGGFKHDAGNYFLAGARV